MSRNPSCVGALIRNGQGRIFVQRRSPTRLVLPGIWDIVGGHIETGETLEEALAREVAEETGWILRDVGAQVADWEWEHDGVVRREIDFLVQVEGNPDASRLEEGKHDAYAWVGLDNVAPSSICECLAPPNTLRGQYTQAGAIVHVRIARSDKPLPSPPGYFTQTAEIIEVFKRHSVGGPSGKVFTFQQNQSSGAAEPYEVGQELVLFLGWWGNPNVFREVAVNGSVTTVTLVTRDFLADLRRLRK